MITVTGDNVNDVFHEFVFKNIPVECGVKMQSRNGNVYRIPGVTVVCYNKPIQRVLFNRLRDCNPFFHLLESLWMLAGCNEVCYLTDFNSRMMEYSDDGIILNGAYGFRWNGYFGYNQLDWIVDELLNHPDSRRCVLQMWDGGLTDDDGIAVDGTGDLYKALHGSKDVPCNLCCTFHVVNGELEMTVFNRSNDILWGMLGANAVHFSFLHEYVATKTGIPIGKYYQVSSNAHIYEETWKRDEYAKDLFSWKHYPIKGYVPLGELDPKLEAFDDEVLDIVREPFEQKHYKSFFLNNVAKPMFLAFECYKSRDYEHARMELIRVLSPDWRLACENWIEKRRFNYERKTSTN